MKTPFDLFLSKMPMPVKLLFTAALMTLGTGYLFALSNVALKIGFMPEQVTLHYYGNEASRQQMQDMQQDAPVDPGTGGIEEGDEFSFDDLDQEAGISDQPIVPIPTLETLVGEGHFHLFGYTSIFFICGLILLFADIRVWIKSTLMIAPFAASVLDIWSMLLTRFVGPGFSWMLIISGAVMSVSFLLVFMISIYQLWFLKTETVA